jgi:hypothetical protein
MEPPPHVSKYNKRIDRLRKFKNPQEFSIQFSTGNTGKEVLDFYRENYKKYRDWFLIHKHRGDFSLILLANLEDYSDVIDILGPDAIFICTDMEKKSWIFVVCSIYSDKLCDWLCETIERAISFCNHDVWQKEVCSIYKSWNLIIPKRVETIVERVSVPHKGMKVLKPYHRYV